MNSGFNLISKKLIFKHCDTVTQQYHNNPKNMNTINISILGPPGTGKSTLLNTLFVVQYAEMGTPTTKPQIYTDNSPKAFNLIKLNNCAHLQIYDTPGHYNHNTDFLTTNFYKFHIVILVFDINIFANDEINLLKLIFALIKENEKYDKTDLIIIFNKCDDMYQKNGICGPQDSAQKRLLEYAEQTIESLKNEIYPELNSNSNSNRNINIHVLCCSIETAYIYRTYKQNPSTILDTKYSNKFGFNEYGKTKWNKYTEEQKQHRIKKFFTDFDYDDLIESCGFKQFTNILATLLTPTHQYNHLISHIKYELHNLSPQDPTSLDALISHNQTLLEISTNYKIPPNTITIHNFLTTFFTHFYNNAQSKNYPISNTFTQS